MIKWILNIDWKSFVRIVGVCVSTCQCHQFQVDFNFGNSSTCKIIYVKVVLPIYLTCSICVCVIRTNDCFSLYFSLSFALFPFPSLSPFLSLSIAWLLFHSFFYAFWAPFNLLLVHGRDFNVHIMSTFLSLCSRKSLMNTKWNFMLCMGRCHETLNLCWTLYIYGAYSLWMTIFSECLVSSWNEFSVK